ncbi:hypothetical protein BAE44_0013015 [Dichanthelium oligosanthes]|uniref:RNase H type-1 domain-containing protein n=1 Tax=Dichanthelium oligosanthes TaxID=888268 RepID=A0A1E5VLG8_9POAL|nr:hypothetical protein BAE44_0013015 [Dichanthelium oligosanthes]
MRGSTGAVIRDDHGNFVATPSYSIDFALDAATAEALALRNGLYLANQMGCNKLVIQSACLEVVETMKYGDFQEQPQRLCMMTFVSKLFLFLMYLMCIVQERLIL